MQDLKCLDGISSPSGMGKTTSVMFSLRNTVGCLVNALKIFEVRNRFLLDDYRKITSLTFVYGVIVNNQILPVGFASY